MTSSSREKDSVNFGIWYDDLSQEEADFVIGFVDRNNQSRTGLFFERASTIYDPELKRLFVEGTISSISSVQVATDGLAEAVRAARIISGASVEEQ